MMASDESPIEYRQVGVAAVIYSFFYSMYSPLVSIYYSQAIHRRSLEQTQCQVPGARAAGEGQ